MDIALHIRSKDLAKDVATLALTSRAVHNSDRLKEIVDYCIAQMEHCQSNSELLAYTRSLVAPYEEGDQ